MKKTLQLLMALFCVIPFIQGGYFLHSVYLIGILSCIILAFACINSEEFKIPLQIEGLFLLIITIAYGIITFTAIDPGMAFLGFLRFTVVMIVYILIHQYDDNERSQLVDSWMYGGVVMAILSIVLIPFIHTYLIQNNRLGGFIQYANVTALYMVITILLLLERGNRAIYWLIPFLISAIYLSFSRSMYMIAFVAITIGLCLYPNKIKRILPPILIGIVIGVLLSKLHFFQDSIYRVKEASLQVSEFQSRLIYYEDGMRIIKENPLGLGYYGYFYIHRAYQTGVYYIKYIHNSLLQIALDIGLIGALSFIALIVSFICFNKKTKKIYKLIVIVILGHSLIDFDFQFIWVWFVMVLLMSLDNQKVKKLSVKPIGVVSFMGLASLFLYFTITTGAYYFDNYSFSSTLYPFYTEAQFKKIKQLEDENDEAAKAIAEHIYHYNSSHLDTNIILRDYYMKNGAYDKATFYGKKVIELNLLDVEDLEIYARSLLLLLKSDIMIGDINRQAIIEEIEGLDHYIISIEESLSERAYKVKHQPQIYLTETLKHIQEEAKLLR